MRDDYALELSLTGELRLLGFRKKKSLGLWPGRIKFSGLENFLLLSGLAILSFFKS
jgi:hypothetical protein